MIIRNIPNSNRQQAVQYGKRALWAFFGLILLGVFIARIYAVIYPRSLFLDEALLVENIITRTFSELCASPLINVQTAPVLWLYVVKGISFSFDYTESSLRLFLFFSFIGLLVMEALLLRNVFKVSALLTTLAICVTASLKNFLYYSNELKPYISDVFFILVILYIYHLFINRRINLSAMAGMYCIFILLSTPAIFFVAAIVGIETMDSFFKKNWNHLFRTLISGGLVGSFFLAYYVWWLQPAALLPEMANFWSQEHLTSDIRNNFRLIYDVIGSKLLFLFPFAIMGLGVSMTKGNRLSWGVGVAFCILCVASALGKYPPAARLWLFTQAFVVMYATVSIVHCWNGRHLYSIVSRSLHGVALLLLFLMLPLNFRGLFWVDGLNLTSRLGEEINPLIIYVREHIKADESLYSTSTANAGLRYKNGYNESVIGESASRIIYGKRLYRRLPSSFIYVYDGLEQYADDDFKKIVDAKKCYILHTHTFSPIERVLPFMKQLHEVGTLTEVLNVHQTPLYYFVSHEGIQGSIIEGGKGNE